MDSLKFHARGRTDHLKSLRDTFRERIKEIQLNKDLSDSMKEEFTAAAKEEYKKARKGTLKNLY